MPALSSDIISLIGIHLVQSQSKATLRNLALSSRETFGLLFPLLHKHVILTDSSAPLFFARFRQIKVEDRHYLFVSLGPNTEEARKTDLVRCHPAIRLRMGLQYVEKLTVHTSYYDPNMSRFLSVRDSASYNMKAELLLPNLDRLVITSKCPSYGAIGLIGRDYRPGSMETFLRLACCPTYICCTPQVKEGQDAPLINGTISSMTADDLRLLFSHGMKGTRDCEGTKEIINIHQGARIAMPIGPNRRSRVSFAPTVCPEGDGCAYYDHPDSCRQLNAQVRMTAILGMAAAPPTPHTDSLTGDTDSPKYERVRIVTRPGHSDRKGAEAEKGGEVDYEKELDGIITSLCRTDRLAMVKLPLHVARPHGRGPATGPGRGKGGWVRCADYIKEVRKSIKVVSGDEALRESPCEACGEPI